MSIEKNVIGNEIQRRNGEIKKISLTDCLSPKLMTQSFIYTHTHTYENDTIVFLIGFNLKRNKFFLFLYDSFLHFNVFQCGISFLLKISD